MKKRVRVDFHVHTCGSGDSLLTWPFILFMCRLRHIDAVAITDHNELDTALKYAKILKKYRITVIPGEEVLTSEGEIIGLFLKKRILPGLSATETVKQIKEQGGLVYIPHPFDKKRHRTVITKEALASVAKDVDMIEVHNGRNIDPLYSEMQRSIAEEYGLPQVVGSDSHAFFELGRNITVLKSVDKSSIKENLSHAVLVKKPCLFISHEWTKVAKALKMIFGGRLDELYGIIRSKCKR